MIVSLIIPTFNAEKTIGELLRSVRTMTPAPDEVIVADDCSTDTTLEIASGFNDVICRSTPINSGPGAARNLGAQCASGGLLLFIDSDCIILDKDCIEKHMQVHKEHPECLLTGAVKSINGKSIAGMAAAYYEWHEMIPCYDDRTIKLAARVGSAHFSISKAAFDRIGGFNESIRAGEDTVLHHDAMQNGLKSFIRNDIVVGHLDITNPFLILRKLFCYGKSRILIKRLGVYGKYSWLLPDNMILALLMWPLIGAGLTIQIVVNWLPHSRKVLLFTPLLFLYSMAFSLGAVSYLWTERAYSNAKSAS